MSDWRRTREYRIWRARVVLGHRCKICGSMEKRAAHHILHATYFVDQRFDVENGVCLCYECHMNFHCNFKRSYRTKCDRYDWENFLHLAAHFHGFYQEPVKSALGLDQFLSTATVMAAMERAVTHLLKSQGHGYRGCEDAGHARDLSARLREHLAKLHDRHYDAYELIYEVAAL